MPKLSIFSAIILCTLLFANVRCEEISFLGSFRHVKGEATLISKKDGASHNAIKDMQFFEGDKILTKNNSFAILNFQDGSTIKLDPNSELTVLSLIGKSETGYFGVSRLMLSIGGVMVDVVKKFTGPPSLEIETKNGIAFGVRGTKFYTFIENEAEDTWTVVFDGEVIAFDFAHDDNETISAGKSMVAIEGELLTLPQEYTWSKKISWNNDPNKGDLDSQIGPLTSERRNELSKVLKKILNRQKRPFINSTNNPRKMPDRARRQVKEIISASESASTVDATKTDQNLQKKIPINIVNALAKISENHPNAPKPILATEEDGQNLAQDTCTKVAPSGFPCIVRSGFCIGEEVSAAIFYNSTSVYNVCVKIINGIFL